MAEHSLPDLHFENYDLAKKWKSVFIDSLYKICQEVHFGTAIDKKALDHVEELIVKILCEIVETDPKTTHDVEKHVELNFPQPINQWAVREAQEALAKGHTTKRIRKSGDSKPVMPINRIHAILRDQLESRWKNSKSVEKFKLDQQVTVYIVAVLEYIAADILKLTGNYVKNIRSDQITLQDLKVALRADRGVLMDMFYNDNDEESVAGPAFLNSEEFVDKKAQECTYEKAVKDLIIDEQQYLKDLNLLIHVFRQALDDALPKSKDLDVIFGSNIMDIHELTVKFLRSLEDAMEMSDTPCAGGSYLEISEGAELDAYFYYAKEILSTMCLETLYKILEEKPVRRKIEEIASSYIHDWIKRDSDFKLRGNGFYLAIKYVLPKLLLGPVLHCFEYFEYLELLIRLGESRTDDSKNADMEDLTATHSLLVSLKSRMEPLWGVVGKKNLDNQMCFRFLPAALAPKQLSKIRDLQRNIEGWTGRDITFSCTEFIREGILEQVRYTTAKISLGSADTLKGKPRLTERHVFLFDNLIVICNKKPKSSTPDQPKYKFKEKLPVQKVDILDRDNADGLDNAFEIRTRDKSEQIVWIFKAKTPEEKQDWMALIVFRQTRSMLDRMLDSYEKKEEERTPWFLPSPEQYRFAEQDSDDIIVFEDYTSSSGIPVVRGGTVLKLVERLTYHMYTDSKFMRTFLTTFRSFCSPRELLDLLIERFDIPSPQALVEMAAQAQGQGASTFRGGQLKVMAVEPQSLTVGQTVLDPVYDLSYQRFRKEYIRPVQLKVLSVIRQWVGKHWYDFKQEPELLERLKIFLNGIQSHMLKKYVLGILATVERLSKTTEEDEEEKRRKRIVEEVSSYGPKPPSVVWHLASPGAITEYELLTLHPLEVARQLTLLESELYRAVLPVELVGAAWTKADKHQRSPQLLKLTRHSNRITYWLERCVVEAENAEERIAIMNRVLEIVCVFEELNNFTGLFEVYSALESAAVHRLKWTWEACDSKLYKTYDRWRQMFMDKHHKDHIAQLRKINPPCVPFFGCFLSNILFMEEGNPLFLKNTLMTSDRDQNGRYMDTISVQTVTQAPLISFHKCRMIASVIQEIQMYQNQPYALQREPSIMHFFESLNPLADFEEDKEQLERYLFNQSVKIEPRECDSLPVFDPVRKYSLKSPGIKPPKHVTNAVGNASMTRHGLKSQFGASRDFGEGAFDDKRRFNPGSPTSKEFSDGNSDFALVVINPGHSPRYVSDLPSGHSHRPRNLVSPLPPTFSTSPPNQRSRSTPSPPGGSFRPTSGFVSSPAPPLPPRTVGASHRPSPLPGPKPSSAHHINRDKSHSPGSPMSPLQNGNGTEAPSQSSNFIFPPPLSARRVTPNGGDNVKLLEDSAAAPVAQGKVSPPPAIPPRTPARNGKLLPQPLAPTRLNTHSPLPPPLSPTAVEQAVNSSATPRTVENGEMKSSWGGESWSCMVGTPSRGQLAARKEEEIGRETGTPPPLFPRRTIVDREEMTPPPRPPKRQSAPPLPPKTYKQRLS